MKTFSLTFVFFISALQLFSQSKDETQEWIAKNLNQYFYNEQLSSRGKVIYNVSFKNNYLCVEEVIILYGESSNLYLRVPIKNIKQINIYQTKNNALFGIVNMDLIYEKGKLEFKRDNEMPYKRDQSSVTKIETMLHVAFINNGMKERMEKAFLHLVKLYGGSATVYKEPF